MGSFEAGPDISEAPIIAPATAVAEAASETQQLAPLKTHWLGSQLTPSAVELDPVEPSLKAKIPINHTQKPDSIYIGTHTGMAKEFDNFCKVLGIVGLSFVLGDSVLEDSELTAHRN